MYLMDLEALAWLRSCVPPETESLSRMEGAVVIAFRQTVTVIAGDGGDGLPALLAGIPLEPLTVVMDAYTTVSSRTSVCAGSGRRLRRRQRGAMWLGSRWTHWSRWEPKAAPTFKVWRSLRDWWRSIARRACSGCSG